MPPAADQIAFDGDPLDLISHQEEQPRKRSPGRKGQGKNRRKHGYTVDSMEKPKEASEEAQTLSYSPPTLQQRYDAKVVPQSTLTSNLDPSLESYGDHDRPRSATQTRQHTTASWAQDIPYGRSPPRTNGTISGSPPLHREVLRGGFAQVSPPLSPRTAHRQLLHRESEYQSFGGYLESSPPNARPQSMYSRYAHHAPPHSPHANVYGLSDMDFGSGQRPRSGHDLGRHDFCAFDGVPIADADGSAAIENVLLVGSGQKLNVYQVGKSHLKQIGSLDTLRAYVIAAKILPRVCTGSPPAKAEPLVCLVLHGLCERSGQSIKRDTRFGGQEEFDASSSTLQALNTAEEAVYQTTVEIYSLSDGERKTTLFRSPVIREQISRTSSRPVAPPAIGALSIQAAGRFIMIASGTSGEVFLYETIHRSEGDPDASFRWIGKIWTRISSKVSRSMSSSSRESASMPEEDPRDAAQGLPIASLSARWLAIVPPTSSSQTSFHGAVPEKLGTKVPGGSSHSSLAEPQVTCQLDTPDAESFVNRLARDATQELVKGALWVGSQGLQVWNNYWAKPADLGQAALAASPNDAIQDRLPAAQQFPPTHAQESPSAKAKNMLAVVSILDLDRLSHGQHLKETIALQPVATFSLPNGCTTVSFAPSGLQIFTASAKGDVQQVWDLMRMIHGDVRAEEPSIDPRPPNVREVTRFTRMTEARVVDVAWTQPRGERLALATDNGTVHIYELPASAFYWPPLRQKARVISSPPKSSNVETHGHERGYSEPIGTGFSSAFGMLTGRTQPLLSAVRGRTPSAGNSFPTLGGFASTAGVGAKSGKAVASGINRSFTAAASGTVNTLRHLGENRITLPGSPKYINPGCLRWLSGKDEALLAVSVSGLVRIHSISQSKNPKAGRRRPSAVGSKPVDLTVPRSSINAGLDDTERVPDGSFFPRPTWLPSMTIRPGSTPQTPQPLSYAEIETQAPYQPFHTDHRVTFYTYNEDSEVTDPHQLLGDDPWVFGEDIPATRRTPIATTQHGGDRGSTEDRRNAMENIVRIEGNEDEGQQIVVTTRRKRARRRGDTPVEDDGEFFEDDLEVVDFAHDRV